MRVSRDFRSSTDRPKQADCAHRLRSVVQATLGSGPLNVLNHGMNCPEGRPLGVGACGREEARATSPTAAGATSVDSRASATVPRRRASRRASGATGYAFVYTVIDDHSRVVSTDIHDDETAVTAVAVPPGRSSGSPTAASPSNACCLTRRRVPLTPVARPARRFPSRRSTRARTGPRPMARSSASTGPRPTGWPTPAATPASRNVEPPSRLGCTGTTTTARTRPAATSRPPPD